MPNRLAREASPYLKQHAGNPVDWYPWGREALARAQSEDKPILLSIGYSACHWCHVMERESFENAAIAELMNASFVCIKVDREERPDLDQIYQLVVQLLGRSGGWPLTVFLTPAQKPFFGGTYFPPVDRHGMPAFPRILQAVAEAYRDKRADIELQSTEIASAIGEVTRVQPKSGEISRDILARAASRLGARFDDENGGFGSRPKFPSTMSLEVLLHHAISNRDERALGRVRKALDAMRAGGIYDQLGGGFHRYSTDEEWLVPHFEKMLYDNALLLRTYVDGYRVFDDEKFANTARGIVRWLEREMLSPEGGFYATQDADSEGEEGKFFVWTVAEVRDATGSDAELACARYGVTEEGNFPDEPGANVLSLKTPIENLAVRYALAPSEVEKRLAVVDAALLAHREKRTKPFRDEKILASWNALLISSLAEASRALREPRWLELARHAFDFVWGSLTQEGRVRRHASSSVGFLDDHAFLGCAALDLYEATGEGQYMACAKTLAETIRRHYEGDGTFYLTPDDGEDLITRPQDLFDHSVPSATSMAVLLFLRLGDLAVPDMSSVAERQVEHLAGAAEENPFGLAQMALAADRVARGATDIVLVAPREELIDAAFGAFVPHRNIAWVDSNGHSDAPSLAEGKPKEPAAYVCRDHSCSPPALRYRELLDLLSRSRDRRSTA